MHTAGEAHLALVHVADAGADLLIEQRVGQLGPRFERAKAANALVDVCIRVAEVGAEVLDAWPRRDRHRRRGETHGGPAVDVDHHASEVGGLPPPLARRMEVPAAGHAQVSVEHQAALEVHEQVLALGFDLGDALTGSGVGSWRARRIEPAKHRTFEGGSQSIRDAVDAVAFGHEPKAMAGA